MISLTNPITATQMKDQVLDLIQQYCDVLRTNFQTYSIKQHQDKIEIGENVEYHREQIDKLSEGEGLYRYYFEKGRKYARIIMQTPNGQRSAHAFVDMNTADVYKAASWKGPAKGIRYNLLNDNSKEEMYKRADWAGGHLYA